MYRKVSLVTLIVFFLATFLQFPAHAADPTKILLAKVAAKNINPAQYLVSEKFDGVRAIWDGKQLKFRSGNIVNAPAWFLAKLPATPLDGELWLGRRRFEELSGLVRQTTPDDAKWREIKYQIFELPEAPGSFTERAARIEEIVAAQKWPQLLAVKQNKIADNDALQVLFQKLVAEGAEGLMLHLAAAPYVTGRNDVLLKLKPQEDAEATVIAHIAGKGKYTGKLGALKVKTADGVTFNIGSGFTDAQRETPPPIGAVITYKYRSETKNGVPRFATFMRLYEKF
jgi:DNA ligase 1